MSSKYGVNVVTSVNAARPIKIDSTTVIAIVGSCVVAGLSADLQLKIKEMNGIIHYSSVEKAVEDFGDSTGTLRGSLDGIADQNVNTSLIVSVISITETASKKEAEKFYEDAKIKSKIIEAVGVVRTASAVYGTRSNLIIAPRFAHDSDVKAELKSVAVALNGTAIVDLNAKDEADAVVKIKKFGSKHVMATDPYVKVWDTKTNASITEPASARIAGLIARTDGVHEYGFADSASNRVIEGISGIARAIDFTPGQNCEADRLRDAGIATIINEHGFRLWGFETTDIDPIWRQLERVRVFARIGEAVQRETFWAIDRRADILNHVRASVDGMLNGLKGANVLIGYEVFWHPEKNTKENITAGKFYLVAELQNMPTVRRLEVELSYVDRYAPILMKMIGGKN